MYVFLLSSSNTHFHFLFSCIYPAFQSYKSWLPCTAAAGNGCNWCNSLIWQNVCLGFFLHIWLYKTFIPATTVMQQALSFSYTGVIPRSPNFCGSPSWWHPHLTALTCAYHSPSTCWWGIAAQSRAGHRERWYHAVAASRRCSGCFKDSNSFKMESKA